MFCSMRLPPMQRLVGEEVSGGIADREATQDQVLGRDCEMSAHDFGTAGDRHRHAASPSAGNQWEEDGLNERWSE